MRAVKKQAVVLKMRKLYRFGGSLGVFLPPKFITAHGLKEGDMVPMLTDIVSVSILPPNGGTPLVVDGDGS